MFLFWSKKNNTLLACEPTIANYLRTIKEETYEAAWLRSVPPGGPRFEEAYAILIEESEFEELKEALLSDLEIPFSTIEEQVLTSEEIAEEPKLLSLNNATEILHFLVAEYTNLKQKNTLLEDCILELSQELYK